MNQMALNFTVAREQGRAAADACLEKAEDVAQFDSAGAAKFILGELVRFGESSGEILVEQAITHGFRPHDARAFGPIFAGLSRKGLIRTVGYCTRTKGHGTAGGRLWDLVR